MYLPCSRTTSKMIALILLFIGVILIPDIIVPTFTDIIVNVPLATLIALIFSIEFLNAYLLTFALGFLLVILGFLVYPYNTKRLIIGKMKHGVIFIRSNPLLFVAAIILMVAVYFIGETFFNGIKDYAMNLIGGL